MRKVSITLIWIGGLTCAYHYLHWQALPIICCVGLLLVGMVGVRVWWARRRQMAISITGHSRPPILRTIVLETLQMGLFVLLVQTGVLAADQSVFFAEKPNLDKDRPEFEQVVGIYEDAGGHEQACQMIAGRLEKECSADWQRSMTNRLYRNLVEAGKRQGEPRERRKWFAKAIGIGDKFGFETDAARALDDVCKRRIRFDDQIQECRAKKDWPSLVTMAEAALLEEQSADDTRLLGTYLRDALLESAKSSTVMEERRKYLEKCRAVCSRFQLDSYGAELELFLLEKEAVERAGLKPLPPGCKADVLAVTRKHSHGSMVVDIWVEDATGKFLEGLEPKDFRIYWESPFVACRHLDIKESSPTSEPMNLLLAIDTSGSMKGQPMEATKTGACKLLDQLSALKGAGPAPAVKVISFDTDIKVVCDWTPDLGKAKVAVSKLKADGSTALYKAMSVATADLDARSGQKHALFFTDGKDTVGEVSVDQVIVGAKAKGIPVSVIGLRTDDLDFVTLQRIAKETGGEYREAAQPKDLLDRYQEAARMFRPKCYRLSFTTQVVPPLTAPGVVQIGGSNGLMVPLARCGN